MIRRAAAPLIVALATTAVWFIAFHTGRGARLDGRVLSDFTDLGGWPASAAADLAGPIPFAVLSLVLLAIPIARRRPAQALAVAVVLAGANLTTQLLKQVVTAPRPAAAPPGAPTDIAWPSGHTTAATALAFCFVLVVPGRWRPLAAAVGAVYAVAEGFGVLASGWHYPSDVLGAFGVAAVWLALGVAALRATTGRADVAEPPRPTTYA
jgi:membrane-associated phospholipid phosphatase